MNWTFFAFLSFFLVGALVIMLTGASANPNLHSNFFLKNRIENCSFAQVASGHTVADNEEGHGYYRVKSYNRFKSYDLLAEVTLSRQDLITFANNDGQHKSSYQSGIDIVDGTSAGITDSNLTKVAMDYVYLTYLCPETRSKTAQGVSEMRLDSTLSAVPLAAEIELDFEIMNYYSFSDLSNEQVRRMVNSFKVRLLANDALSLGSLELRTSDRHIIVTSFQADPIDKCKLRLSQGLYAVDSKMCWDNDNSGDEGGTFGLFTSPDKTLLLDPPVSEMGDSEGSFTRHTCPSAVRRYVNQEVGAELGPTCNLQPEHEWLSNFPGHWMDFEVCTQKRRSRGTSFLIFPTPAMRENFRKDQGDLGTTKWILYVHGGSFYGYDTQNAGYNNVMAQMSNYMKKGAGILSIDYRTLMGDQVMYLASRQEKGTKEYNEMAKLGLQNPDSTETFSWTPWVDSRSYTGFGYRSAMLDIVRGCSWLLDRKASHIVLCGDSSGASTVLIFYKFLYDEMNKKKGQRTTDKITKRDDSYRTTNANFTEHFFLASGKGVRKFASTPVLTAKQAGASTSTLFDDPSAFQSYDTTFQSCQHLFGPTQKNNNDNTKNLVHYGNLPLNVCEFGVCQEKQSAPAAPVWTCNESQNFTCDKAMPCVNFHGMARESAAEDDLFQGIDLTRVLKQIKGIILYSPWVDLACESSGYNSNAYNESNKRGDVFYPGGERLNRLQGKNTASFWLNKNFLDTETHDMKEMSPFQFNDDILRTMPRIFAVTGSEEVLMAENVEFQKRVAKAGGRMRLEIYEHMWHGFSTTYVTGCGSALINAHAQESVIRASEFADSVFSDRPVRAAGVYRVDPKYLSAPYERDRSWEFAGVPFEDNNFQTTIRSCPLSMACTEYFYSESDSIQPGRNTESAVTLRSKLVQIPLSNENQSANTLCDETSDFWGNASPPACEPKYMRSAWNFSSDQSGTITDWDSLLDFESFLTKEGILNQWQSG